MSERRRVLADGASDWAVMALQVASRYARADEYWRSDLLALMSGPAERRGAAPDEADAAAMAALAAAIGCGAAVEVEANRVRFNRLRLMRASEECRWRCQLQAEDVVAAEHIDRRQRASEAVPDPDPDVSGQAAFTDAR